MNLTDSGQVGMGRGRAGSFWIPFMAVLALALQGPLHAKYREPKQLSQSGGQAVQTAVGVDLTFNIYVAWTAGGEMMLDIIGIQSSSQIALTEPGLGTGDPTIVTNSIGTTFIAFTQEDPVNLGREILLTDNFGGLFTHAPVNISQNPGDDYAPQIFLDPLGEPHLVWARRLGNKPQVVYYPPGGPATVVADGDSPGLAIDDDGVAYIIFTRDRDLRVVSNWTGSFGMESRVTTTPQPQDEEFFPSIAVSGDESVFVTYEWSGGLYYHQSRDGGIWFGPPRPLDSGGATRPDLKVTGRFLSIVYEKGGDLLYIFKVGEALSDSVRVFDTPDRIESGLSLALDTRGDIHISFIKDGEVFYTNNADELTVEFIGAPLLGPVPLEVHFTDISNGPIQVRHWDFGDGSPQVTSGREIDHTYNTPGKYTVTLEISGVGSSVKLEKLDFVLVETPNNSLTVPDNLVYPGQKEIWFPLIAAHKKSLLGFQAAGTFDSSILLLKRITYEGTLLEDLKEVEFYIPFFTDEPGEEYFYLGVILDYVNEPHYGETIPTSTGHRISHLIFDCSEDAPLGGTTVVDLKNGVGPKDSNNLFIIGQSEGPVPAIQSSIVTISDDRLEVFLRGDIDGNGEVDITDAIMILSYLYLGRDPPWCIDAADVNDSGAVDISDPISLLTFLFLGGRSPAVPFPFSGLDPSPDDIEPCGS
jgi:PKD repeat protein